MKAVAGDRVGTKGTLFSETKFQSGRMSVSGVVLMTSEQFEFI